MSAQGEKRSRHPWHKGRPKVDDPKGHTIKVRVTASERETLRKMAQAGDTTLSGLLLTGALAIGPKLQIATDLASEIHEIGRALNQILARTNSRGASYADRRAVTDHVEVLHSLIAVRIHPTAALGAALTSVATLLRQWRRHDDCVRANAVLSRIDEIISQAAK